MTQAKPPSRLMPLAVAGAAVLVAAGAGLFYYATQNAKAPERGDVHKVVVNQTSCDPADFTVPAGRVTFDIHNASDRPIEWEILDGVMVVEEYGAAAQGGQDSVDADRNDRLLPRLGAVHLAVGDDPGERGCACEQ